jgi:tetratricopeptide (TPR) repeat protein
VPSAGSIPKVPCRFERAVAAALIAGLALTLALAPARARAAASDPPQCVRAAALLAAGETSRARAEYVRVIVRDPSSTCAAEPLKKLNAAAPPPTCVEADKLLDAGQPEKALAAYETVSTSAACRAAGLTAARKALQLCSVATAQKNAHRTKDAIATYKLALAESPGYACATKGIAETRSEMTSRLESTAITVLEAIGLTVGLFALLCFACLLLGYNKTVRRRILRFPLIGRVLAPRVAIGPFDGSALATAGVGPAMVAQLKERLERHRGAAKHLGFELDFGGSEETLAGVVSDSGNLRNALAKAKDISPDAGVIASALEMLYSILPVWRLSVTAVLDPPSCRGAGATFTLEEDGRLAGSVHLAGPRLAEPATADDYLALVGPAAVWLQYELARALSGKHSGLPDAAESFALVREGFDQQMAGNDQEARKAYEEALALDRRNWAARVNLAILEARLVADYPRSIQLLEDALQDFKRAAFR